MLITKFKCLLIQPEFPYKSFWSYKKTCELLDAKYPAAPLGIITVAALLPKKWELKLVDCNIEELKDNDIAWADIVFSGGMIPQQSEHLKLIEKVKSHKKIHVVGGPDPTSSPHIYDKADYLVLGEAEITLPLFLQDFCSNKAKHIYDCKKERAEIKNSPTPRFDLLNFSGYLHVGIQFSRGCPFKCEFCDIIELFGRVPRVKQPDQIITELQTLYDLGYRGHIDIVDDNFASNKKAAKQLLPEMLDWQTKHHWPFEFSIEASINIANDEKLLGLMKNVGFCSCFVGIETPDKDILQSTNKTQNTRQSISESIKTIGKHGILVNTGYILGFDDESGPMADKILKCIEECNTPANMVGLLFALPNTQLTKRLEREGRLFFESDISQQDVGDQCVSGLNFITSRPREDILEDYVKVLSESYDPINYFTRVINFTLMMNCSEKQLNLPITKQIKDLRAFFKLIKTAGINAHYRKHFWKTLITCLRKNPKAIRYCVAAMALYLHFGPFSEYVVERTKKEISLIKQNKKDKKEIKPRLVLTTHGQKNITARVHI